MNKRSARQVSRQEKEEERLARQALLALLDANAWHIHGKQSEFFQTLVVVTHDAQSLCEYQLSSRASDDPFVRRQCIYSLGKAVSEEFGTEEIAMVFLIDEFWQRDSDDNHIVGEGLVTAGLSRTGEFIAAVQAVSRDAQGLMLLDKPRISHNGESVLLEAFYEGLMDSETASARLWSA